jgi:hypothetical protein
MKLRSICLFASSLFWIGGSLFGQQNAPNQAIPDSASSSEMYLLQYKLKKGETVRWDVEHVASTKMRAGGEMEESSSRCVSRKAWAVSNVDAEGNMILSHSFESFNAWQKTGDEAPISYNSQTDKEVPYEYESTAASLGKVLAEFTISPDGQVKQRESSLKELKFGVGDITVPLPKQPIAIGQKWNVPTTFNAVDEDQRPHELKARLSYQLVKVTEGNAFITFRTEILTPVESEKIQSQIMQQKTKGYLVFDIANGRMIRKEIEWNEKVQGFEGGDSFLEYIARMSERLVEDKTKPPQISATLSPLNIELADESLKSTGDVPNATNRK